jgi:3,4-dihydroxy 2-butanone 4-phosphate synthase/GTP cyclohydrolase II
VSVRPFLVARRVLSLRVAEDRGIEAEQDYDGMGVARVPATHVKAMLPDGMRLPSEAELEWLLRDGGAARWIGVDPETQMSPTVPGLFAAGECAGGLHGSGPVPLVRVHSECMTGDVLGSLKCDCGPQLAAAQERIAAEAERGGSGVVVYLRGHEGRGIGLANKIRAYELQEQGLDTVDANLEQGLPVDAREYDVAAAILRDLGVGVVRLMTNNPRKVHGLGRHGIAVEETVGLIAEATPESAPYLDTKRDRLGHSFPATR